MSLKVFHIVFVTLASTLCFAFAGWALGAGGYRPLGFAALGLGVGLIAYGFWFWNKINKIKRIP